MQRGRPNGPHSLNACGKVGLAVEVEVPSEAEEGGLLVAETSEVGAAVALEGTLVAVAGVVEASRVAAVAGRIKVEANHPALAAPMHTGTR